jgi:ABC-type Fe3+ transport system permease subunit
MMNYLYLPKIIAAASCGGRGASALLKFPTWYEYLPVNTANNTCSPMINNIDDVWLIVAAVIEILLRVAAIMAVGFIIYGGIQFTISQGDPQQTNAAKGTLTAAVVGLVICLIATIVITYVAESIN